MKPEELYTQEQTRPLLFTKWGVGILVRDNRTPYKMDTSGTKFPKLPRGTVAYVVPPKCPIGYVLQDREQFQSGIGSNSTFVENKSDGLPGRIQIFDQTHYMTDKEAEALEENLAAIQQKHVI